MPRSTRGLSKSRLDSGCQALWPWQSARVAKESVSPDSPDGSLNAGSKTVSYAYLSWWMSWLKS
jgi:hypothetical protein